MASDVLATFPSIQIKRTGPLPIHEQLRSTIELAIASGELTDGAALPSVRDLAHALHVAPGTVLRAYRDLETEHLIRVVPKRGFFVIGVADFAPGPATAEVQALVDQAFAAALRCGLTSSGFLQFVAERVCAHRRLRQVAVVGKPHESIPDRVATVTAALTDLAVEVIGVTFGELEAMPPEHRDHIECFLVPVLDIPQASRLLDGHRSRILPMTRTLRSDVRECIATCLPDTRFGIVATNTDLLGRMLAAILRIHPLTMEPLTALTDDAPSVIAEILREADVLVVSSIAGSLMERYQPFPIPSLELVYVPDTTTLWRLRIRLGADPT
jgi:GntR family transcriptional regulator